MKSRKLTQSGFQVAVQELYKFTLQILEVRWIAWHVPCFWEQHQFIVFPSSGQGFDQPHGMLGMYVFVNQTLHEHQLAKQLRDIGQHRTGLIASLVGSR